ncbi:MAG TPA: lamin tail domain-containing protein, partial [Rubricoccaceae bacterium]|nr:lamin tail domain-containing protein [Rubricoccaceae bacterium]
MNRSILLSLLGLLLISTAAAQTTHTVTLSGTSFTPADLTIEAGDTVLWDNVSGIHSVNGTTEAYPDNPEGFTSGAPAAAPWQYEFTFTLPGEYDYHCDVHGGPGFGMRGHVTVVPATTDSPLIISEYVEGSSFNKAIELYNPSDSPVDLAAGSYTVQLFYNGNPDPGDTIALTGTVEPGGVFVLAEDSADPAILAVADQLSGSLVFSGDDAVVLFQGAAVVDVIGQVGFDPGAQWGTGDTSTADNTLRREGDACTPDTDPSDEFDPAASYTGYPIDTFDGLGNPGDLACGGGTECDLKYLNADLTYNAGTRRLCATVTVRNNGDAPRTARLVLDYNRNGGPPQGSKTLG